METMAAGTAALQRRCSGCALRTRREHGVGVLVWFVRAFWVVASEAHHPDFHLPVGHRNRRLVEHRTPNVRRSEAEVAGGRGR